MKLIVKTLQQKAIQLSAEPSETILNVKQKLNQCEGFPVESQKLIYSGKILTDDQVLETLNIKESEFMVVMVTKPKPTSSATPSSSSTATALAPSSTPATTTTATPTVPAASVPTTSTPTPTTSALPESTPVSGDTSFATGAVYETAVANMIEMGFPRDQVVQAMRAAYNNADRAADYLVNGIPADLLPPPTTTPAAPSAGAVPPSMPAVPTTTSAPSTGSTTPASQNLFNLAQLQQQAAAGQPLYSASSPTSPTSASAPPPELVELANNPQFDQLRQLVQVNPQLLQPILQQMAQTHPQLMEFISTHQDEFLQLLLQPSGATPVMDEDAMMPTLHISEEEKNAIDRLVALGFERHVAIEAFFACDKNEEMAANYLFENQDD